MRAKDKFLEKIKLLTVFLILCFSHNLNADDIYNKIFNYNDNLKNTSAKFIQTNTNDLQEGKIYFGDKRIKIDYNNPQRLTLILSEKKGIYTNHELQESQFFFTNKSYVKIFFNIIHKQEHLQNTVIKELKNQIEVSKQIQFNDISYNVILVYENDPLKLRRLEILGDNEKIQMGFFDHNIEEVYDKKIFSMIDPYLN